MAVGDAAVAAGMSIVSSTDDAQSGYTEINQSRDYLADHITNGGHAIAKITGLTTALAGKVDTTDVATNATGLTIPKRDSNGQLTVQPTPTLDAHAASKKYVDDSVSGNSLADGPTSTAYARSATGSGWYQTWMNSSLQFMRNTSSRRYKCNIRDWSGGVLDLRPVIFDRRGKDTPNDEVGFIAEEVLEHLPEAVVYFDGKVDGISDRTIITALVSEVQRLAARVEALEKGGAA